MRYAETEEDAEQRYRRYRDIDPFVEIDSSLLNSADIADYVSATGMIVPFHEDEKHLKPASYGVALRGRCIFWNEEGEKKDFILSDTPIKDYEDLPHQKELRLERNSIAFVTLESTFRLPHYIALRFNLTIREVYRGLLLGTGPIVDPGFNGKLSFPLHNMTDNVYYLRAGDEMVWVEFTKLSRLPQSQTTTLTPRLREGKFFPFPERKLDRKDLSDYLYHAGSGAPIRSSIPVDVGRARQDAQRASEQADHATRTVQGVGLAGALATAAVIAGLVYAGYQVVGDTTAIVKDVGDQAASFGTELARLDQALGELGEKALILDERVSDLNLTTERVSRLEAEIANLKSTIQIDNVGELARRIAELESQLQELKRNLGK